MTNHSKCNIQIEYGGERYPGRIIYQGADEHLFAPIELILVKTDPMGEVKLHGNHGALEILTGEEFAYKVERFVSAAEFAASDGDLLRGSLPAARKLRP